MRAQPFFSVIIPAFNRGHFLEKAVRSVLEQTFHDFELIIIDDGSTDGTDKLVSSFSDARLRYFHQENRGVAAARNKGLELSKGRFIAFLDSDDWWDAKKLEVAAAYIAKFPGLSIFHTEEIWYRKGKLLNQKKKHKKPEGRVYKNALNICCIGISTAVVRKDVFSEIGVFDENFEDCEDYDLWLRAASRFDVKLIPEALTLKDGGRQDQLSSSVWGLDRFRIRALEKMILSGGLSGEDREATLKELEKKCGIFALGAEKRGKKEEAGFYRNLPGKYLNVT